MFTKLTSDLNGALYIEAGSGLNVYMFTKLTSGLNEVLKNDAG